MKLHAWIERARLHTDARKRKLQVRLPFQVTDATHDHALYTGSSPLAGILTTGIQYPSVVLA